MSEEMRKPTVLNLSTEVSQGLLKIIEDCGYEVITNKDDGEFEYVLVKDYEGSFSVLAQDLELMESDIPIISLSSIENKFDFIGSNGRAWINEEMLEDEITQVIVKRLFQKRSSLQLEYILGDRVTELKSCKLTGHMSVGHYTDIIACEAFENNFDIISIRNYFVGIVSYLSYLNKGGISSFPFEVDFGAGDKAFMIQIHADVRNFVIEYLFESFFSAGGTNPFRYLLDMCSRLSNFFDVYYLENASKIVISGIWFKGELVSSEDYFSSFQINEIQSFDRMKDRWENYVKRPRVALEQTRVEIARKLEGYDLPGDYVELLMTGKGNYLSRFPVVLKQMVEFVIRLRGTEEFPKDVDSLIPDDILQYLCSYPNVEMVQKLNISDLDVIIKCLLKPEMLDSITGAIDYFQEEGLKDEKYRDPYFDSIYETVSALDLDLANQMLGQGNEAREEAERIVAKYGHGQDVFGLKGNGELVNEEFWNQFGHNAFEELEERLKSLDGVDLEEVEKHIIRSVTERFNFDPQKAKYFAGELFSHAKATLGDIEEGSEEYAERLLDSVLQLVPQVDYDFANKIVAGHVPDPPSLEVNDSFWEEYHGDFVSSLDERVEELEILDDGLYSVEENLTQLLGAKLNIDSGKAQYTSRAIIDDVKTRVQEMDSNTEEYKKEFFSQLSNTIKSSDIQMVKGIAEQYRDDVQVVRGVYGNISQDYWKVNGDPLIGSMKEIVQSFKNNDGTIGELRGEIYNILDSNMDMGADKLELLTKSIMDNAATIVAAGEYQSGFEEILGDLRGDLDEFSWESEVVKRDDQIGRMKSLIDNMKVEIVSGREADGAVADEMRVLEEGDTLNYEQEKRKRYDPDDEDESGISIIKGDSEDKGGTTEAQLALKLKATENALKKSQKETLRKQLEIKKGDERNKDALNRQQKRITYLEQRINELVGRKQIEAEDANYKDRINKLKLENKSLGSMLEMANKRIANVSTNAARSQNDTLKKSKFELDRIRENYGSTMDKMTKYKLENQQLGAKLKAIDNSFRVLQTRVNKDKEREIKKAEENQIGMIERTKEIAKLRHHISMSNNEKKALEIKINDLTGKVKALTTQNITAAQQAGDSKGQTKVVKSENENKLELRLKQMEQINDKLATQGNKLGADLAAAKKDLVRYKAEATLMKNRNQELERKAKQR